LGGILWAAWSSVAVRRSGAVDIKPSDEWQQLHPAAENQQLDLRRRDGCKRAVVGMRLVDNLASDMGGAWDSSTTTRRFACSRS
jgi:hypothetical protein